MPIGRVFDVGDRRDVAAAILERAEASNRTALSYDSIGYRGHAAMARMQAETLGKAAGKVMSGQPVQDWELKEYEG